MSEHPHPDPDLLNAFLEGMLPEHERLACLSHLAGCAQCREIAWLAQEALPAERLALRAPEKVPLWKRWFTPIPALGAAAVFGLFVVSFALYRGAKPVPPAPPAQVLVARAPETANGALSDPGIRPVPPAVTRRRALPRAPSKPIEQSETRAAEPPPVALARPALPPLQVTKDTLTAQSGVTGTVTDAAGGVIPRATVNLRQIAGPVARSFSTGADGQFNVAGIEPGRYELQVAAPGFQEVTKEIDIQPSQMARADSTLQIGSMAETVEISASVPAVNAESAMLSRGRAASRKSVVHPALDTVPAGMTVASGKVMLATNSAGALLRSDNGGKKWKAVKPVWQGKVGRLATIPAQGSSRDAAFQLTTDTGAVWLSREGSHWYSAPAPR